jgi:plastocyanin
MRKLLAIVIAGAVFGVLAAVALGATTSVKVGDNYYVRAKGVPTVSVSKGSRLKFNFRGKAMHNAKGVGISLGSDCRKVRDHGSCTTSKLRKTGTFTIFCEVHGKSDQRMRVKVR